MTCLVLLKQQSSIPKVQKTKLSPCSANKNTQPNEQIYQNHKNNKTTSSNGEKNYM